MSETIIDSRLSCRVLIVSSGQSSSRHSVSASRKKTLKQEGRGLTFSLSTGSSSPSFLAERPPCSQPMPSTGAKMLFGQKRAVRNAEERSTSYRRQDPLQSQKSTLTSASASVSPRTSPPIVSVPDAACRALRRASSASVGISLSASASPRPHRPPSSA